MTLTELRYLVALAEERHFGRAAQRCFVSQPTLSVAIRKFEEKLGVALFERGSNELGLTPVGIRIVAQAERTLQEAEQIKVIASENRDPCSGPLRLGAIHTVGPYLLPCLVPRLAQVAPQLALTLQESYTSSLLDALRHSELDVIVLALPHDERGLATLPLYEEPFRVVIPKGHHWQSEVAISPVLLLEEPLLMLSAGNCFRDQVLDLCAHARDPHAEHTPRILEGSSLETLKGMVSAGMGITVMPSCAADPLRESDPALTVLPFSRPEPHRRIGLVWRTSFPRPRVIDLLRSAIHDCALPGCRTL